MADWWPFDRSWAEEWRRNWTEVLSLSSAAAASLGLPQPSALAGDKLAAIVDTARAWLIGKKTTFSLDGRDLTLVLEDLSVEGPDQVRIRARDVEWDGYQFGRTEIRARNMHLRPGTKPTLVAAPVLWEAFMPASAASRWLAAVSPRLALAMRAGVPQISMAGAPWIRLEIEAGAEGKSIRVVPRALYLLDRRVSVLAPAFHVAAPDLPLNGMLTSVAPAPGGFVMRGVLTEWQKSLSRADLERLLAAMRAGRDSADP
jgi:hypothetical protein